MAVNNRGRMVSVQKKVKVGNGQETFGAIRKKFPLQKPRWEKTKLTKKTEHTCVSSKQRIGQSPGTFRKRNTRISFLLQTLASIL